MNQLFEVIFSDSDIAKTFQMSKTKVSYVIIFGLADYFYNSLITLVKKSPFYSLLFDESLKHKVLSKEQMGLQVRFYDDTVEEVLTRYLDSCSLYCLNAVNLSNEIIDAINNLDQAKISMLGMDGPNVNWLIFDKLNRERKKHNHSPLYNIIQ